MNETKKVVRLYYVRLGHKHCYDINVTDNLTYDILKKVCDMSGVLSSEAATIEDMREVLSKKYITDNVIHYTFLNESKENEEILNLAL
ncbi:hypothetical protein [Klebsiella pneumoniae]|uniref:hypothetical protein n=1 Tax=Klebsiella pneumoniae TaxID=573 RepID=UPI001FAD202E|nr:hypothetical protein [Klebsiella pneumoniae]MCI7909115.1 hypothetical protein [Klebsiella pneumoniae]HBV3592745.1 hypothetical protein [Klebsiella pneumoniae]